MKRAKKLLILLGVLIVVCAAAFAASKLNPELNTGNDGTDSSAASASFSCVRPQSMRKSRTLRPMTILTFRLTARALTAW